ncbi:MAG TPA: right-handed parallel beta-helix repeat-containing protein [Actinomycetota bacterium]|nr:right-handed parallel beta-helix repeat-containing protein [Actinomycetota bacterium]
MRRLSVAALVALLVTGGTAGTARAQEAGAPLPWWQGRPVPTMRALHTVHFHDAQTGWAGADDGIVYRTQDGGRTWEARHTGLFHPVTIMDWIDGERGWAGSVDSGIATTSDGGRTWRLLAEGDMAGWFLDMNFVDHLEGYASGRSPIFFGYAARTVDGGETWDGITVQHENIARIQESVHKRVQVSSDRATLWLLTWLWVDGDGVSISRDGGETWRFVSIPSAGGLSDLAFATDEVGVAVGRLGDIHRTTDGGETWLQAVSPPVPGLRDVEFVDATRGWAVGDAGTVLATVDGGLTWAPETAGTSSNLSDGAFLPGGAGWTAGPAGEVRHRAPTTTTGDLVDAVGVPTGEPRPPIVVAGDEDFDSPLSGVRSGSGTAEDPYVIEGWDVVPVGADGITIAGTTAHVVIRGNRVHDAPGNAAAIRLVDAANVTVEGNVIDRTAQGVAAAGGGPLRIASNSISRTSSDGVEVNLTSGVTIEANSILRAGANGIETSSVREPRVTSNEVRAARLAGVRVSGGPDAVVRGNRVEDAQDGVSGVGVDRAGVRDNTVSLAGRHGISVQASAQTSVADNHLARSGQAEILVGQGAVEVTVEGNSIKPRQDGVRLSQDTRTVVRDNTIEGGSHRAISAARSTQPLIANNTVNGSITAIRLDTGTIGGRVLENVTTTRLWGISVEDGSHANLVEANTVNSSSTESISSTIHFGLNVSGASHDNVLRGNLVSAAWNGIEVWGGSLRTRIESNEVNATFFDGIRIEQGATDTVVSGNTVTALRDAIRIWGLSDRSRVVSNVVLQAGESAVSILSSSDLVVSDNEIRGAAVGFVSEGTCVYDLSRCDSARNELSSNSFAGITGTAVRLSVPEHWAGRTTGLRVIDNSFSGPGDAVEATDAVGLVMSGNNLAVSGAGLRANGSDVDARGNWWGAANGPSGIGPGSGAAIAVTGLGSVLFDPWLVEPNPSAG